MIHAQWEDKPAWGKTRADVISAKYSHHTLRTIAGGCSSVHWHKNRLNRFVVVSGRIAVVELYGWETKRTVLDTGASLEVPSLVPHQFQSLVNSQVIEEYWPDRGGNVEVDDIVRLSVGCMVDPSLLYASQGVFIDGKEVTFQCV